MLTAKDIMTTKVVTVMPGDEVVAAAKTLLEMRVNGLPVVDGTGKLVGVITQSDLIVLQKKFSLPSLFALLDGFIPISPVSKLEKEMEKITATRVEQAMTPDPITVSPETPVDELASIMVEKRCHSLPVVDDLGLLIGIVGMADILKTLVSND